MAAQIRPQEFSKALDWGLRWTLLFGLPAGVGLVMLAGPVMATLFQSEAFSVTDVGMSGASLSAYALGIAPLMLAKVLAPGYYARQDVRTPLRIAAATMALNLVLNLVFIGPLQHVGLALATSVAAAANGALLFRGLRRRGVYAPPAGWLSLMLKGAAASGTMLLVLWWGGGELEAWTDATAGWRILYLGALIAGAALVYFTVLLICGVRPRDFRGRGPAAAG
jgi:putative peptidoglycan lipid II flippase